MDPMTTSLVQVADQLTRVIVPIIIVIGVVGNLLNIIVLTRPTLYQHACSRYFLANAASNLFYSGVLLIYRLLIDQYQTDPAKVSVILCKITTYINHVGLFLPTNFIILASIDRWCASSSSVRLRKFNNVKIARSMIFYTTILFALFFTNSAIAVDLQLTDPFGCRIRANTVYKQVYVFIQASMVSFISPCLMAVFGIMTIYNIKKTQVLPVSISHDRRTGSQLACMLLLQVGTYIILNLPSTITYLIFVLPNNLRTRPGFFFAHMLSVLPLHASCVTAFFLYILSAHSYRKELVRIVKRIFRSNDRMQVHQLTKPNNAVLLVKLHQSVETRTLRDRLESRKILFVLSHQTIGAVSKIFRTRYSGPGQL